MSFIITDLFLLLAVIFLLMVLSMVWPPDSPWAPWWQVNKETARRMCSSAKVSKKDIVYDLGSGSGTSLIVAAKEFGARGVGIEIDPLRVFISRLKARFNGLSSQIVIKRRSFFDESISKASVVFLYLVPKTLERLKPKLLKELKKGTRIVTVTYPFPGGLHGKAKKQELKPLGIKKSLRLFKGVKNDKRKIFLYIV